MTSDLAAAEVLDYVEDVDDEEEPKNEGGDRAAVAAAKVAWAARKEQRKTA